ncbi:MAG: DUF3316 domain-containing protein [Bacteroidales bacterium]|nr:DUF3316 domain-containing protein [Bacteroidales bacterium]
MNIRSRLLVAFFLLAALLSPLGLRAQEEIAVLRPVTMAYTYSVGTAHNADTYLSPIKYSGWSMALGYERLQAMRFDPERWVQRWNFTLQADHTENLVKNAVMWYWGLDVSWTMMRRWGLSWSSSRLSNLTLAIGPWVDLDLGCFYTSRNGNNPASAKGGVLIGATGYAAASLRLGRLPVTLRYQPSLAVTGAFFAPDYGELYYEIYLGDRSGLAHWAWPGNYFNLRNQLTADLHLGGTSIRLGYHGSIYTTRVNHLTTRRFTHWAVIGLSGEWISINPRKKISDKTRIINAILYPQQ